MPEHFLKIDLLGWNKSGVIEISSKNFPGRGRKDEMTYFRPKRDAF